MVKKKVHESRLTFLDTTLPKYSVIQMSKFTSECLTRLDHLFMVKYFHSLARTMQMNAVLTYSVYSAGLEYIYSCIIGMHYNGIHSLLVLHQARNEVGAGG